MSIECLMVAKNLECLMVAKNLGSLAFTLFACFVVGIKPGLYTGLCHSATYIQHCFTCVFFLVSLETTRFYKDCCFSEGETVVGLKIMSETWRT